MASDCDSRKTVQISLHDVTPRHMETISRIHTILCELGVGEYSMLVIPNFHGKWPMANHPDFCRWLQDLMRSGVRMIQHGYTHLGNSKAQSYSDRIRSLSFTRGEGEFLGLTEAKATDLIEKGRTVLRNVLKVDIDGFVAPAWLYSAGTVMALRKTGFLYTESRWRSWNPSSGKTLLNVPVVNYAGGGWLRKTVAGWWVILSRFVLSDERTVRFALHPDDFEDPWRTERTVAHLRWLLRERVSEAANS